MTFAYDKLLLVCLAAAPLLWMFYAWTFGRRRRLLERFVEAELRERLLRRYSPGARRMKAAMMIAGLLLALLALSRPQWGMVQRPLIRKGVDVIIAIDASTSMQAADIKPSRMARAQQLLTGLVRRMQGHRIGVVAFAGEPVRVCPLTLDYGMAMNLINTIDSDLIPVQGTAIARTIEKSIEFFDKTAPTHKVLVLLTDGEDQVGRPADAARKAAQAGIIIHAIGIGSTEGAPIFEGDGGIKKDEEGKGVVTRLDFQTLQEIALATGGKAIIANPGGDLEVREIMESIDALERGDYEERRFSEFEERFQWFLLPAILLLMLEPLKSDRARRRQTQAGMP